MGTTHSTHSHPTEHPSEHPSEHHSTHKHHMFSFGSHHSHHARTESSYQSIANTPGDDTASEASNRGGPTASSAENTKEPQHRHPTHVHKLSPLDNKVTMALQRLWRAHKLNEKKEIPFTRILLKFPQAAKAFNNVRKTFREFDKDKKGYVELNEVPALFRKLGVTFSDAEITQVYEESDLEENGELTFKEIIISLAIAFLVHRMPSLEENRLSIFYTSRGGSVGLTGGSGSPTSNTSKLGEEQEIRDALQLAVDAFLWFDTHGNGCINRNNMSSQLETSMARYSPTKKLKKRSGSYRDSGEDSTNWSIWDRRFEEMDWNHNGTIHFNEFLMAFESWVGVDYDEDDDDEKEKAATYIERETSTTA